MTTDECSVTMTEPLDFYPSGEQGKNISPSEGFSDTKGDEAKLNEGDKPNYTTFKNTVEGNNGPFWSLSMEEKAKYVLQNTTIEPFLFMFLIAFAMCNVVSQNLVLEKYCLTVLNFTEDVCKNLKTNQTLEKMAQGPASDFQMYKSAISTIPTFFLALFLGSWSDKHGRKLLMLTPCVGGLLQMIIMIINVYFMEELRPEFLLLADVPVGLAGGLASLTVGAVSYLVDTTTSTTRTFRFALMQAALLCGAPIGMALGGLIFTQSGYFAVFIAAAAIKVCCFTYVLLVLNETIHSKAKNTCEKFCDFFDLTNIRDGLKSVFKKREQNRHVYVPLLIVSMMIGILPLMAEMNVAYMYVRYKFKWETDTYSYYTTVVLLCNMIGLLVFLPLFTLRLKISDVIIGIIGAFAKVCSELIVALSPEGWILFATCPIVLFNGMSSPIIRSMLSKIVNSEEQGKVMSVVGAMEAIVPLVGAAIYTQVYKATLSTFPGAFYVISACLCVIPVCLFVWISKDIKRREEINSTASSINQIEVSTYL